MSSTFSRLKQIYLGIIPAYPLGYVLVHGFRGDQIWSKLYVNRSELSPSDQLKDLVEQELEKMENLKKVKFSVALTDDTEPKTYGALFLTSGAELQFPLRMSIEDVETARRMGANLELDLGLSKHRRKVEVRSDAGDELISRMMLSDAAKTFIVQRQLQIANSGQFFCVPIFAWFTISTVGYIVMNGVGMVATPWIAGVVAVCGTLIGFQQFSKYFEEYKTKKADEMTISRGQEYVNGSIDYFKQTMKLNRMYRRILGEEGKRNISKKGDCLIDPIPLSKRLRIAQKQCESHKNKIANQG